MVSTWVHPACHSCDFWALRDKPLLPPRCASLGPRPGWAPLSVWPRCHPLGPPSRPHLGPFVVLPLPHQPSEKDSVDRTVAFTVHRVPLSYRGGGTSPRLKTGAARAHGAPALPDLRARPESLPLPAVAPPGGQGGR